MKENIKCFIWQNAFIFFWFIKFHINILIGEKLKGISHVEPERVSRQVVCCQNLLQSLPILLCYTVNE